MKNLLIGLLVICSAVGFISLSHAVDPQQPISKTFVINIPDINLRGAISAALNVGPSSEITSISAKTLKELNASNCGIEDLTGLEYFVNLVNLDLQGNKLTDASNLAVLSKLTSLWDIFLTGNKITAMPSLANSKKLQKIFLSNNNVADLSFLKDNARLKILYLANNGIIDNSLLYLANKPGLWYLDMTGNKIKDLSPLSGDKALKEIFLSWNNIEDISILLKLPSLKIVELTHNPLSEKAKKHDIPTLIAKGVEVGY